MSNPPAKFDRLPLNAIPTATPAEANKAMNELVSIPKTLIMIITKVKFRVILTKLLVKVANEASTCRFVSMFITKRFNFFTIQRPMKNTRSATSNLEPNETLRSISLLTNVSKDIVDKEFSIINWFFYLSLTIEIFYFSSFRVSFIDILKYTESLGRIKLRSKVIIFIFFYKNYNRKRLYSTFIFNVSLNNCIFVTCEKLIVRILWA